MTMTPEQIAEMIETTGIQSAYYQFPEDPDNPIEPPFICFWLERSADFYADGINYLRVEVLNIELYTKHKDYQSEKVIENMLMENGLAFSRDEINVDEEGLHETIYYAEVAITLEEIE